MGKWLGREMSGMLGRYTAQLETRHGGLASRSAACFLATLQFEMSRLRGRSNGVTRDRCFHTHPHKPGLTAMPCTSLGSSVLHFLCVGSREVQCQNVLVIWFIQWACIPLSPGRVEEAEPKGLPSLLSRRSIKDDFFLMPATLGYFLGDSGWGALTPGDPQSLLNTILILLL